MSTTPQLDISRHLNRPHGRGCSFREHPDAVLNVDRRVRFESSHWSAASCASSRRTGQQPEFAEHVRDVFRSIPPKEWDVHVHGTGGLMRGTIDTADAHRLIALVLDAAFPLRST